MGSLIFKRNVIMDWKKKQGFFLMLTKPKFNQKTNTGKITFQIV